MTRPVMMLVVLALAGCGSVPLRPRDATVCYSRVAGVVSAEPTERQWIELLTQQHEDERDRCEFALSRMPSSSACGANEARPALTAITPTIVVESHRPGEPDIVWVATRRSDDGWLHGPVAIAVRTDLGLEVDAIGWHFGPPTTREVRLWRVDGRHVVGLGSDIDGSEVVDLLLQSAGTLARAGVELPDGSCAGPGRVVTRGESTTAPREGWSRRVVRTASIASVGTALVVEEHVTVEEFDAEHTELPPRVQHDADGERLLVPEGAGFRADRLELSSVAWETGGRATQPFR